MRPVAQVVLVLMLASGLAAQQTDGTRRPTQPQPPPTESDDAIGRALGERNPDINHDPPAYLSGAVVMHDNSPVHTHTQVELFCHGFRRFVDTVTGKGEFDLDLSGRGAGVMDAGRSSQQADGLPRRSSLGIVNLNGCHVQAELPGYSSSRIDLEIHSIFDSPDIGQILLTPLEGVTGTLISANSLLAPKRAQSAFSRARSENLKSEPNLKRMEKRLQSAVHAFPKYAEAWDLLGRTQLGLGLAGAHATRLGKG